jgi:hypothetical protein
MVTDEEFQVAANQTWRPIQNAPESVRYTMRVGYWPPLSEILDERSFGNKQEKAISFSVFHIGLAMEGR